MKKDPVVFLKHILDAIKSIEKFTKRVSKEMFFREELINTAVVKKIEIIGEATKNLLPEFKKKHNSVSWKEIARTRDKLIHHYFGIDLDIVWNVVKYHLPELKEQITELLKNLKNHK